MRYPQSEAVGDSAYGSGWIGSGFSQTLQIMMMRARIPNKITAAKFYAMSLESFSAVNKKKKKRAEMSFNHSERKIREVDEDICIGVC